MSQQPAVSVETSDSIAIIRFNRPAERNPLSRTTLLELNAILSDARSNPNIQAVIFTGSEDVFLSGANIRELAQLDSESALAFSKLGQNIFQAIADAEQITIAAINGYCMGGGLDLALACDIRIASETAVFSHPGARLGIITGWGGTQRLPRIVGTTNALEFFVTAGKYSSKKAFEIGLVSVISDQVLEAAIKLAQTSGQKKGAEGRARRLANDSRPSVFSESESSPKLKS